TGSTRSAPSTGTSASVSRRSQAMKVTRAVRAAAGGRYQLAEQHLAKAKRAPGSLRTGLYTAMATVILARREGEEVPGIAAELRENAHRIAGIVGVEGLAWPLAILDQDDREAILGAVGDSPHAAELRLAFARIPAAAALAQEVVELHPRELVVLRHLVTTGSRSELADRSFVSVNTIKTQLRSVYAKLGVNDRESALLRAAELGLLDEG
ncbi:MAG: response regulator transcription factor, partial [Microbacteriaceae bacterium]|nr:response regulator transcription factor [Microbacteriaceae bacterium]